jgi:hypothetical protein
LSPTDAVQLNTSVAGTHSIDYVVTADSGLTSTTTRTVIIEAANDNQPTAERAEASTIEDVPSPVLESDNDNSPPAELPATGVN